MSTEQPDLRAEDLLEVEPQADGESSTVIGRLARLCRATSRSVQGTGAGVSLRVGDRLGGTTAASSARSADVEDLQFVLGVGPCQDAFTTRRPVLVDDLERTGPDRWPGYPAAAGRHGVRAVFAFPIQVGETRIGVLDVYRDQPGPLSSGSRTLALSFADLAVGAVLRGAPGPRGGTPGPRDTDDTASDDALGHRAELHQAQGMVAIRLGVSLDEAMAVLRARAYAEGRPLFEVARDVVARRLNLG